MIPRPALAEPLLKVRHLRVWFPTRKSLLGIPLRFFRAVEDVSFDLHGGEVLSLIGEPGCGKSTVARAIMGLQEVESGRLTFEGQDLVHLGKSGWRHIRRDMQLLFPDPLSALNPRLTVGDAVMEPLQVHRIVAKGEMRNETQRLLDMVGLPASALSQYPHQLKAEECLRTNIARAIASRPKLIICDESVSALDEAAQRRILDLLKDLQAELKLSCLLISRDLHVVHYVANRVLVMQAGKIIERGDAAQVMQHPQQEYTKKLVAAVP